MTTLFILILIQIAGVLISMILSFYSYKGDKRRAYIGSKYRRDLFEKRENWPWLIDYFQTYPQSSLRHEFPHLYKVAKATKRYKEINRLKAKGLISERKYEKALNKILPLIDIKAELGLISEA